MPKEQQPSTTIETPTPKPKKRPKSSKLTPLDMEEINRAIAEGMPDREMPNYKPIKKTKK